MAFDVNVIKGKVGELLHSPIGKHYPGNDGVDKEDEGVGDTRCDTVTPSEYTRDEQIQSPPVPAFPSTRTEDSAACRRSTAGGGYAPDLALLAARSRGGHVHILCSWRASPGTEAIVRHPWRRWGGRGGCDVCWRGCCKARDGGL